MKTIAYSQHIILLIGFCFISYKIIPHGGYAYFLLIPVILFTLLLANIIKSPLHYAITETRVIEIKLTKMQKDFDNLEGNNLKIDLLNNLFEQIEKSKAKDLNRKIIDKVQSFYSGLFLLLYNSSSSVCSN